MLSLVVADDAPFIREIVRHIAEKNSIRLLGEASDGEEAVALALSLRPQVILMDLIMPKKNGIEAAKEIISQLPDIKIIAFSTADQETMVMRALESGCSSFLEKPFTAEQLLDVLRSSIKG